MLNCEEIKELLKQSLEKYLKAIRISDLRFIEHEAAAWAYIKVLNDENLTVKYMDVNKAKELLNKLN